MASVATPDREPSEQPTRPERGCKKTAGENLDLGRSDRVFVRFCRRKCSWVRRSALRPVKDASSQRLCLKRT
jgi:hypothetical protein